MSGHILIAHEIATTRILLKVQLSAASYVVDIADSRDALFCRIKEGSVSLLIVDAELANDPNGDFFTKIRSAPNCANLPIIVLVNENNPQTRLQALEAGADEVMDSPARDGTLLARIRNLLRTSSTQEEISLRDGTALALGMAESGSMFQRRGVIFLVSDENDDMAGIAAEILHSGRDQVEIVKVDDLLARIADDRKSSPDAILMPPGCSVDHRSVALIPELRSRKESRHAALIALHNAEDAASAARLLDFGADDAFSSACMPNEAALRIKRQLERKLAADELRSRVSRGLELAMIDPLTGLFNRRYALPHLNRIANRSRQKNRPFAVLMIDLDHFKSINDRYGHAAGDEVLRTVGSRLRDNLRPTDLAARIGGEEFLVVLPETKWADACATAERLRMIVGSEPVTIDGNKQRLTVTASIGIARGGATIRGRSHDSVGILLDRADAALRGAKQDGRNRVIYARSALSGRLNAQHLPAHPSAGS